MSYKSFYEDLDSGRLEEDAQFDSNPAVQLSWQIRTNRTIMILAKLIHRFRKSPILVDIGCAGTWLNQALSEKGCNHRYVGCDISLSYLRISPNRLNSCRVLCDASSLPFIDSGADIAASFETLEHLSTPSDAALELERTAKSFIIVSVPLEGVSILGFGKRFDRFSRTKEQKVQNLIDRVGWEIALQLLEKNIGAPHVKFFTKDRLHNLFTDDAFEKGRIRGALFFLPGFNLIVRNKALKRIYLIIERVILSRLHIFIASIRWLPFGRIGNRYGILVMYRRK